MASFSGAFSVDVAGLSMVSHANFAGTGSASMTVHGSSMGLTTYTGRLRKGQTACEATEWGSESSLTCMAGLGLPGGRRIVMLTVGERGCVSVTQAWSTDVVMLSGSGLQNVGFTGSVVVTVHGTSFGVLAVSQWFSLGASSCELTSWISSTAVLCSPVQGVTSSHIISVTSESLVSTLTHAFSHDALAISSIRGLRNIAITESPEIRQMLGVGIWDSSASVRVGFSSCESTAWSSISGISCRIAMGSKPKLSIISTLKESVGSLSSAMSYNSPEVSAVSIDGGVNTPVAKTLHKIMVLGKGFALSEASNALTVGGYKCEETNWISRTSLVCLKLALVGRSVRVGFSEYPAAGFQALSYDSSVVSVATRINLASSGSASLTVGGVAFGLVHYSSQSRSSRTSCEASDWESDSSLRGMVPSMGHRTRRLIITAAVVPGTLSAAHSADIMSISKVSRQNVAGLDTTKVIIEGGNNVAYVLSSAQTRLGSTTCATTEWEAETSVRCLVGKGAEGSRRVAMTAGMQTGSVTHVWSVDIGTLRMTGWQNRGLSASVVVHVAGPELSVISARGHIGQTACEATEWESETSVRCHGTQLVRGSQRVILTAGDQTGSITRGWSSDMAGMSVTRQSNKKRTGSASMTVHGASMGLVAHTSRSREGVTGCEATEWESDTAVRCSVVVSFIGSRRVSLSAGSSPGTRSCVFSLDSIGVSQLLVSNIPNSQAHIFAVGSSFSRIFSPILRVGSTHCEITRWQSSSSLVCRMADVRGGATTSVLLTLGSVVNSLTQALIFDDPLLGAIEPSKYFVVPVPGLDLIFNRATRLARMNQPATGSASLTLRGFDFGDKEYCQQSRIGATASEHTEWVSITSIRHLGTMGHHESRKTVITAFETTGTMTGVHTYDVQDTMSVMGRQNRAGTGSGSVTVHGASMGLVADTIRGRFGHTSVEATRWCSSSSLVSMAASRI